MADSPDSGNRQDTLPTDTETDGPFSRFRKSGYNSKSISSETYKEGIKYQHTQYQPNKTKPVQIEVLEYVYDMNTFPRGKLALINVRDFQKDLFLGTRKGTDKDAEDLTSLFLDIGFIVDRHDNPSASKIHKILDGIVKEHKDSKLSCVAVAILSHGEEGGIVYSIDKEILITDLTKKFRTESLAGKPKIFLFQACRGRDVMDSLAIKKQPEALERDGPSKTPKEITVSIPIEADFLYAFSTVSDYLSFRSNTGSWFIQAVCSVFREHAHEMEVYRMLTRVNYAVANRKAETSDKATRGKGQIASIVSQLRKDLFLYPVGGKLPSGNMST